MSREASELSLHHLAYVPLLSCKLYFALTYFANFHVVRRIDWLGIEELCKIDHLHFFVVFSRDLPAFEWGINAEMTMSKEFLHDAQVCSFCNVLIKLGPFRADKILRSSALNLRQLISNILAIVSNCSVINQNSHILILFTQLIICFKRIKNNLYWVIVQNTNCSFCNDLWVAHRRNVGQLSTFLLRISCTLT